MTRKIVNIGNAGTSIKFGANDMDNNNNYFNGVDMEGTLGIQDIRTNTNFGSGKLQLWNLAHTFKYEFQTSAITADRVITVPLLAADDTMALLAFQQTFTGFNTFANRLRVSRTSAPHLELFRDSSTPGDDIDQDFTARDSAANEVDYGRIRVEATNTTDGGTEAGKMNFFVRIADVLSSVGEFKEDGTFACGGINKRIVLNETGLASARTFTFPDVTTQLAGLGAANIFTADQDISVSGANPLDIKRSVNSNGSGNVVRWYLQDSGSNETQYGALSVQIVDNTDTSEDGKMIFRVSKAGTITDTLVLNDTGDIDMGSNLRLRLSESGLTSQRTFKFPDVSTTLVAPAVATGAANNINTTAAETDMLNYSVPANFLGANGSLRVTIHGHLLQNQATGTTYTIRVKLGATTMFADATASLSQSATVLPFEMVFTLFNKNATNSQAVSGHWYLADTTAPTTGQGDITDDEQGANANFRGTAAIDTTSAATLAVTVQHSVSDANVQTNVEYRSVELIKP